MLTRTVVVVGGAVSGPTAAARARETDERARIVLLERSRAVNYAACGLAYHLSGEVASLEALNRDRAEFFWDVYRVEVRTGAAVSGLDAPGHAVAVKRERLRYDALVWAAGAESVVPDVPGLAGADNAFRFRTLLDLKGLVDALRNGARRVAVIGGGFLGVEAADGLGRAGATVTLLEWGPRILPGFSASLSQAAAEALRAAGATVLTGARLLEAEREGDRVVSLHVEGLPAVAADVVVLAPGVRPRTELLGKAGAVLRPDGSVPVDNRGATSLPDVFACGVCVSLPHAVSGQPVWLAQAVLADRSAQVAGACAAGGDARLAPVLGTAIVRAADLTLGRTGLTETEAEAWAGAQLARTTVHAPSRDPYFPGAAPATLELLYHRGSGRLLGAEVAGRDGVDKRVDVLAAAILGGLTVEQLGALDLAYAPPYAALRDAVNVAGTVAAAARADLATPWRPSEVARRRAGLTLVDVRSADERKGSPVEGAVAVPLPQLRRRLRTLHGKGRLVFVCDTGRLGYLAARIARQQGFPDAGYLSGGLVSWPAAATAHTVAAPRRKARS